MKKKRAFTLLELMVTISILSIVLSLAMVMLIQSKKILVKTSNRDIIQNEIRTTLLNIQNEAYNRSNVVVTDRYGRVESETWIIDDITIDNRELLRIFNKDTNRSKVYVESIENGNHQLIEFDIDNDTNEIISNTKKVLIEDIYGNNTDTILIKEEGSYVTINCSNVINDSEINELDYIITININSNIILDKEIGENNGSESGNDENFGGDNNGSEGGSNSGNESNGDSDSIEDGYYSDWQNDGINIVLRRQEYRETEGVYTEKWKIEIINNSGSDLWEWELFLKPNEESNITSYYRPIDKLLSNQYRIYYASFYDKIIKNGEKIELEGEIKGQSIEDIARSNIGFIYKKIKNPIDDYVDVGNGIAVKLEFISQWESNSDFKIRIKNNSQEDINQWEMLFDFEKKIETTWDKVKYNLIGNRRYIMYSGDNNKIYKGQEITIGFHAESGVVDRNLKDIEFNIIN